jgi:hypothetical protein
MLGRGHCAAGKLPSLLKLPGIGGRIGFDAQEHVFHSRLARSPGHLLRHACRIVLQEGKQVHKQVQVWRIELFRMRRFDRGLGLLQPVQKEIGESEVLIIVTT